MTALEMYNEFNVKYNVFTNYEGLALTKREVSIFLTQAQENLYEQYRAIGDKTEANSSILAPLKSNASYTTFEVSTYFPYSYEVEIPNDFQYKIHERVDTKITSDVDCYSLGTLVYTRRVKPITEDYYNANIRNPFKQPYPDLIWRVSIGGGENPSKFVLICDTYFAPSKYILHYYKKLSPIIVDGSTGTTLRGYTYSTPINCELDQSIHSEIVQEAIRIATTASKDQLGIQIQQMESQLNQLKN